MTTLKRRLVSHEWVAIAVAVIIAATGGIYALIQSTNDRPAFKFVHDISYYDFSGPEFAGRSSILMGGVITNPGRRALSPVKIRIDLRVGNGWEKMRPHLLPDLPQLMVTNKRLNKFDVIDTPSKKDLLRFRASIPAGEQHPGFLLFSSDKLPPGNLAKMDVVKTRITITDAYGIDHVSEVETKKNDVVERLTDPRLGITRIPIVPPNP